MFQPSISLLLFAILFQLLFNSFETNRLDPYILKGVLDCTNYKRLLTKFWKVLEEGLDIILYLIQVNRIYDIDLLISLLLLETTNVTRLKEVSLVRGKLNYLDLIHLRLENEVVCLMACSTINEEDMLGLIGSIIIMLNEIV